MKTAPDLTPLRKVSSGSDLFCDTYHEMWSISHTIMCLIGDSGRLNELKSVDLLVIECPKRAKSVINEVQARCNPYTEGSSGLRALSRPPYMLFRSIFWSLKIRIANGESNFQMQFLRKFSI